MKTRHNFENDQKDVSVKPINKSLNPMIAGILLIIAGIFSLLLFSLLVTIDESAIEEMIEKSVLFREATSGSTLEELRNTYSTCGIVGCIISVFMLLGGILALKRKMWGIAIVAGLLGIFSVILLIIPGILSIVATILIAMSKQEFQ